MKQRRVKKVEKECGVLAAARFLQLKTWKCYRIKRVDFHSRKPEVFSDRYITAHIVGVKRLLPQGLPNEVSENT
jgi:hypothetical protein